MSAAGEPATEARGAEPIHLMIGTPCFGGMVTDHFTLSLLALQAACLQRRIPLSFCLLHNDALITRARNSVVAEFLQNRVASHLLFIDADIGFRPEQVFSLLESGKEVAGAAYPAKLLNWPRIGGQILAGETRIPAAALDYVVEFLDPARIVPEGGFARVRYLGTGFLMIRRTVFTRLAAHYPELKYRRTHAAADDGVNQDHFHAFFDCMIDPTTGVYLSEDFTFCKRWLDLGGEIWVDLNSHLTHIGRQVFSGDLMSTFDAHSA